MSAVMGRGGADFHSPEIQSFAIDQVIKANGLRRTEIVDDDIDESGRTFDRKGIARIRQLVEGGHIDAVAFYDIKRFGRNTLEGLKFAKWLDERGVRLISANEHIDTSTSAGRKTFRDFLSLAEYQSDDIGEWWSRTIAMRAHAGHHHGRALGYRKVDKLLVPDPDTAPAVIEAFRQYGDGYPLSEICDLIHLVTGRALTPQRLKRMLARPVYRGLVELHGTTMPGVHEALCDDATWALVSKRLEDDAGVPPRVQSDAWSLSRLAVHLEGHDGRPAPVYQFPVKDHRDPEKRVQRLICGHIKWRRAGGCDGIGAPLGHDVVKAVLDDVAQYVRDLKTDPAAMAALTARRSTAVADVGRIKAQITATRNAMAKLTTAWSLDQVLDEAYQESMAGHAATKAALEAQLRAAERATDEPDPEMKASAAAELLELWPRMTEHQRNRALRAVVRRVVIRKAAQWREPVRQRVRTDFV